MDAFFICDVLLPFLVGFGGPALYLVFAMAYQLRYDFNTVISTKGGATNVFTSISRVTMRPPWSWGWTFAMVVHLLFNLWISDDFSNFWYDREKLLPRSERDRYLDMAESARSLLWKRAAALIIVSVATLELSNVLHFTAVLFYCITDLWFLSAMDNLEAKLIARCKEDSRVARLRFHHSTASKVLKAIAAGTLVSCVLHFGGEVSYAHSMFGFLEVVYCGCHGWHEFATSAIIVADGRTGSYKHPTRSDLETAAAATSSGDSPEEGTSAAASSGDSPREGTLRSRRLQGLPPEFEPLE